MIRAYLVNHTHWDREWYFTTQDSQVLSEPLFTEVLDELEKHPEVNFCLDGQVSVVNEYVQIHPENIDRIRRLVARNQLFIGPWYTQTDALFPDVESIIRNLVIGIQDTKKYYGKPMMVGYLPDTFGFNAQLPMILNQVGIDSFLFWRGINLDRQAGSIYFKWQGLGKSTVYAVNFPFGYFMGQISVDSKEHLDEFVKDRLDKAIQFEAEHSNSEEVLIPSGIDQMNIVRDLSDTVDRINQLSHYHVQISSYLEFIKRVKAKTELPNYSGELRFPTYARVHRTIGSVRHRIKMKNTAMEQKILRRIEPLMIIGKRCGINTGIGLLIHLWKKLLECQPHDTLGGSIADNVAVDVDHRFKEVNELADSIENMIKRKIAQRLRLNDRQVILFNTDASPYSGYKNVKILWPDKRITFPKAMHACIVESRYHKKREHIMNQTPRGFEFADEPGYWELTIRLFVQLKAMGYQVIPFNRSTSPLSELTCRDIKTRVMIKNNRMQVTFDRGRLNIHIDDKIFSHFISIVDSGNDGDTYDYSPLKGENETEFGFQTAAVLTDTDAQSLVLRGKYPIAYDLNERINHDAKNGSIAIVMKLTLLQGDALLHCHLTLDNEALSHRIRLKVHTQIKSPMAHAEIQGGFVDTKNYPIPDDWARQFVEKPVNIYNFDKCVGISDQLGGWFVFAKGLKEYEKKDDDLFITLMSTTGELGKPNLQWRPGRASGDTTNRGHIMMPTPMAQELGTNDYDLAFQFVDGLIDNNRLARNVYRWLSPSVSYQLQDYNYFINRLDNKIWRAENSGKVLPMSLSCFQINSKLVVTATYPAYTIKHAVVVRLQNMGDKPVEISDLLNHGFKIVNALEETVEQTRTVAPYDMVSLIKMEVCR